MGKESNSVTSKQLMTFVISAQVGIGAICLPDRLADIVGHDGWIPILLSGVITIVLSIIIVKLMERYKNKSILDINRYIYGKYFGTAINIFLILYLFLKSIIALSFFIQIVHIVILRLTPVIVLTFIIIMPVPYLVWNGLKPICRFANVIYIVIFAELLLFFLRLGELNPAFLMPVGVCSIQSILSAMVVSSYSFLSVANISIVYPNITDKENTLKYIIIGIVVSTLFFAVSSAFTTGLFGENMLKHLIFPLFKVANTYKAPLLERINLLFFCVWFPALGATLTMYFFVTYYGFKKIFHIKIKRTFLFILTIVVSSLSIIPESFTQVNKYVEFSEYIGIPITFGIMILNYILSFIKTKGTT